MERSQIKKVPEALLHGVQFVASRLAITAWSEMPGNPNPPAHMAAIHYLPKHPEPESPVPPIAHAA
jgi:hypothetical protein